MKFAQTGVTTLGTGALVRLEQVILQAPDGTTHPRDVLRHPGGVAVLPVDEGQVWLIKQFRVAVSRDLLEIPAGKRDVDGEPPVETARRELYEEMGMKATDWVSLGTMEPSPGYTDEVIHLFAASGIVAEARRPDGVEEVEAEIVVMPVEEALAAIDTGGITDAKTQIALMKWSRRFA
ncbi:MAG TPA: NUDIX hydrolase [Acidimicrobiia bacterium]|nr:NUDIX hydrolase [Acidimicrobiia bacterium]